MYVYYGSYIIQALIMTLLTFSTVLLIDKRLFHIIRTSLFHLRKLRDPPTIILHILWIKPTKINTLHHYLYSQSGLLLSYSYYRLYVRIGQVFAMTITTLLIWATLVYSFQYSYVISILSFTVFILCLFEKTWLKLWVEYRKKQVIYDLFQLSYHLLYFADSNMNIFSKLRRCVPYTTAIKRDLELLLVGWTHNTDEALEQFKLRLACHEAISFIDTIYALKQHQDETFYTLLRERIEEYKEQLELANESKKETTSYILFVLAGIPILYTFQLFIYPWVKEVQQLLLNMN